MNISLVPASVFPISTKLPHLVPILVTDQVVPGMEVILTGFQPYTNAKFSCCGSRSHGFMVFISYEKCICLSLPLSIMMMIVIFKLVLVLRDILWFQDLQIYKDSKESILWAHINCRQGSDHVKHNSLYAAVLHTQ